MLQGPGHSRTALDPVLPPCRPAPSVLFLSVLTVQQHTVQTAIHNTYSYSGAARAVPPPPWQVSMSSSPPAHMPGLVVR
ncbi:hypothetical protein QBC41DRAFT_310950 [Cercophora samala]|uniref:Uncharacterized protein n=1 Tax=Cercophora samala TaxID=330535 RepID=A0AA40DGU9_9PEZI|nr:hypothetical protein QBC41DRAFT_310950 [Cercophora samala]